MRFAIFAAAAVVSHAEFSPHAFRSMEDQSEYQLQCPFMQQAARDLPPSVPPDGTSFVQQLFKLDWDAIRDDIADVLVNKDRALPNWPADYDNYGPLIIRLAWHCAGSYRISDGRGGCDGARMRFDPERSWDDNTNLDKARDLLEPIKQKYGAGLSYGDLYILAGNVAIEEMGGPKMGFCAGRIDDPNGDASVFLGPSREQAVRFPCKEGEAGCVTPLGSNAVGLIYVNPGGPNGDWKDLEGSARAVRDTFARMGMEDFETVALVGGGHAFGKNHGACPDGPGEKPSKNPFRPWQGNCGTGRGEDTVTSGFEGPWTSNPTKWDNEYFRLLMEYKFESYVASGGQTQWRIPRDIVPEDKKDVTMLTADLALVHDPKNSYNDIVRLFAEEQESLDEVFKNAWYKLTTRDMGPLERCAQTLLPPGEQLGEKVVLPERQSFQGLRDANMGNADYPVDMVYKALEQLMRRDKQRRRYMRLAYRCAASFRITDYAGGCNGARIAHPPERDWKINANLGGVLKSLQNVRVDMLRDLKIDVSLADLIVLAGNVAIKAAGGPALPFCPGRVDGINGAGSENLRPWWVRKKIDINRMADDFKYEIRTMGLSLAQGVAMRGVTGSFAMMPEFPDEGEGFLLGQHLKDVVSNDFDIVENRAKVMKENARMDKFLRNPTDLIFRYDDDLKHVATDLVSDPKKFMKTFGDGWTRLMNIDRFMGPAGNVCDQEGATWTYEEMDPQPSENRRQVSRKTFLADTEPQSYRSEAMPMMPDSLMSAAEPMPVDTSRLYYGRNLDTEAQRGYGHYGSSLAAAAKRGYGYYGSAAASAAKRGYYGRNVDAERLYYGRNMVGLPQLEEPASLVTPMNVMAGSVVVLSACALYAVSRSLKKQPRGEEHEALI